VNPSRRIASPAGPKSGPLTENAAAPAGSAEKNSRTVLVLPYWALALAALGGASSWWLMPNVRLVYLATAFGFALVLLAIAALQRGKEKSHNRFLLPVLLLAAAILAGFAWTGWAMWQQRQGLESETGRIAAQGRQQVIEGRVTGLPQAKRDAVRFAFESLTAPPRRYLLTWYEPEHVPQPGERWTLKVKLKPVRGYANPGGFDYPRWLFRHRFVATGWVQGAHGRSPASLWDMSARIHRLRAALRHWLQESLDPGSARALLMALSIGDRSELSPGDFAIFRATGTAHLIAISGLHIGLVAVLGAMLGWLVFWFWPQQRVPRPVVQAVLGWLFALAYAALAGFSVATVRALVAVSVLAVALVTRRRLSPWDVWAVAVLLVLLLDPLAVLDSGFWLSFAAVAALIAAFSRQKGPLSPESSQIKPDQRTATAVEKGSGHKWARAFGQLLVAQVAILLGLMPLSVALFHQIHWLAPVVNFVLIPVVSVTLVPLTGVALLVHAFAGGSAWDEWLLQQAHALARLLLQVLEPLSHWPAASSAVPGVPAWWFALWLMALAAWFFGRKKPGRWLGLAAMLGLLVFALLPSAQRPGFGHTHFAAHGAKSRLSGINQATDPVTNTPSSAFQVSVLDVGQGLSVLVETASHRLLYDTGAAFDSGFNLADAVLLPYFRHQGINSLDAVILSHRDNDHAGAAGQLLARLPVAAVYATFPTPAHWSARPCTHALRWEWDGVRFEVLSPYNLVPYLGNNSSCVLRIGNALGHVLLTGDVETAVEYRLVQAHRGGQADIASEVLLVPHHGSSSSSSRAFVDAVSPQLAINASGYFNAFGHPKAEVKNRYLRRGIPWLDTQTSGLITVHFTQSGISYDRFRRQRPERIWRMESGPSQTGTPDSPKPRR